MRNQRSRSWYAVIACVIFAIATQLHDVVRIAGLRRLMSGWATNGVANVLQLILCTTGIVVAHGIKVRHAFAELGLRAPIGRAAAFSFIAALPMLMVFGLTSAINPKLSPLSVGIGCVVAPFAEEVLFRGYMFGQLYWRARWSFWLSALIPSVLFALVHVYQASSVWDLIGILSVTGLGGLLGCWLFLRWQGNLWVVFGLHSLMNLWWEIFAVDETALGGWLANGARLVTVAVAILLTIYKNRFWSPLPPGVNTLARIEDDRWTDGGSNTTLTASPHPPIPFRLSFLCLAHCRDDANI
jgi:membrane protease YdiL (CAAX protease family)